MKFCLIASSEISIQESLKIILRDRFNTICVQSGEEALEALARSPINIVFLDTNLPDYRGLSLLERIRSMNITVPVIVISSGNLPKIRSEKAVNLLDDILIKPFDKEQVDFLVERALERNQLVQKIHYLEKKIQETHGGFHGGNGFGKYDGIQPYPEKKGDVSFNYQQYAIREFFKSLTHISDIEKLLDYSIRQIAEIFGINKVSIMLKDDSHPRYVIKAAIGLDETICKSVIFDMTSGCPSWFLRFNQILKREDAVRNLYTSDGLLIYEQMERVQSVISAPLFSKGKLIGILNLGNKITGKPYFDEDFELISMISNYLSVAIENSSLYREISIQKRYNENILKNIISGVIAIDRLGRVTTYNKSAERILKVPFREVHGKPVQRLGSMFADILLRTLEGQAIYQRYETVNPVTKAPLGISTSQLKEETGEVLGAIMVFSDLTEAKELEKKIKTVERLNFWSNLANRLAQEIRNPLVAIRTFAQLLPDKYQDEDFRKNFYEIVISEIDRLNHITQKLMEFAQPRENQFEEQDINEIIQQAIIAHEKKIVEKKAKIIKSFANQPLIAMVDKANLQEAISNLIENSLEAIPEGGKVKIKTALANEKVEGIQRGVHRGPYVQITVQDTGCGIPKEHVQEVFSPFFTTKIKGMGFGLPIAQRIIQDHNGKIELVTQVGKGTSFRIYLPYAEKGVA